MHRSGSQSSMRTRWPLCNRFNRKSRKIYCQPVFDDCQQPGHLRGDPVGISHRCLVLRMITVGHHTLKKLWWYVKPYSDKCKKLQFIHKLTASDTSKTAKITKRWYYSAAHWHLKLLYQYHDIDIAVLSVCIVNVHVNVNLYSASSQKTPLIC